MVEENPWQKHTEELKKTAPPMFDLEDFAAWHGEWQDMPEFVQDLQKAYTEVLVRFTCAEDLQKFAALVEQHLNKSTKSIWFPKKVGKINAASFSSDMRYVDES